MTDAELKELAEHNNFPAEHMPMLVQFGRYVLMARRAFDLEGQAMNIRAAIRKEREACAQLALQGTGEAVQTRTLEILQSERQRIAAAIRGRGEK